MKADFDGDGVVFGPDCDDGDATVYPGARELADGIDNDCDGTIDTLFVCAATGPFTTLNDAVSASEDGLTIEVCADTYDEDLDLTGRSLAFTAPEGRARTVIRGTGTDSVIQAHETAPGGVSFEGFTIQGGLSRVGGGGLDCLDGELSFQNGRVRANVSTTGAGLRAESCTVAIQSTVFEANYASQRGGSVYLYEVAGTFASNTVRDSSARMGGGVYLHRTNDLDFTLNNVHDNQSTEQGGGLWARSEPVITQNSFVDNIAGTNGGGVYLYKVGPGGQFEGNTLAGNFSGHDGGGLASRQLQLDLIDNGFIDNVAADDAGGARIHGATATLRGNVFEANVAIDDGGGVKACHGWSQWDDNLFEANSAGDQGGGMESDNDGGDIRNVTFLDNEARHGAGLHLWDNLEAQTVADCTFIGNVAETHGGAIELENAPHLTTFVHLHVEGNKAEHGAGLAVRDAELDLANSVFFDNTAVENGGGLHVRHSTGSVAQVVLDHNSAPRGSAMDLRGTEGLVVVNSVTSWNLGGQAVFGEGGVPDVWRHNNSWMNLGGDFGWGPDDPTGTHGNVTVDPGFTDLTDFTLMTSSALRDAGDPSLIDIDGSKSDIGAFGGAQGLW